MYSTVFPDGTIGITSIAPSSKLATNWRLATAIFLQSTRGFIVFVGFTDAVLRRNEEVTRDAIDSIHSVVTV